MSLQFIPKGPVNNSPALAQIMAWHRPGEKPLSEPMMVSLLMYICVTRRVSQMRARLAACRELAADYNTYEKVLYILNIKRSIF